MKCGVIERIHAHIPACGRRGGRRRAGRLQQQHALPGLRKAQRRRFSDRAIADALGPILAARGLLLVGLDVIGDKLTEINVTSPTCFQEIADQMGFDVAAMFVDALEAAL